MKKLTSRAASTRGVVADAPDAGEAERAGARHQRGQRDQDDQRQVDHREAERRGRSPGIALGLRTPWQPAAEGRRRSSHHRLARRLDRSGRTWPPSAKCSACALSQPPKTCVDGEQLELGEARRGRLVGRLGLGRAVEVAGDDRLRRRRVEEVEIGLRHLARAACVDIAVDQGDRRLGQDRERAAPRSRTCPRRIPAGSGRPRSPRRCRRRRCRAARRSWSSRARRCRAPARSDRSPRRTCAPPWRSSPFACGRARSPRPRDSSSARRPRSWDWA